MRWLAAPVGSVLLVLVGCQGPAPPQPSSSSSHPSCPERLDGREIEGNAPAGESLWGLLFGEYPIARAKEIKIAWRMTGAGAVAVTAVGPDGQAIKPVWGPEVHGGSNWQRPGDEWGTGFVFPAAGCWTLRLDRGATTASAALLVTNQ